MNNFLKLTSISLVGLTMAGCAGSSDGGGGGDVVPQQVSARFSGGEDLASGNVTSVSLNYSDDTTAPTSGGSFSMKSDGDGGLIAMINGKEHAFTKDHQVMEDGKLSYYEVEDDANSVYYSVWGASNYLEDIIITEGKYSGVLGMQTNQTDDDGGINHRAYAVIGSPTIDTDVLGTANATYSGRARIDAFPNTGFINNAESRTKFRGDVTMNADFAASSVDGAITNWTQELPGSSTRDSLAGTWTMNPTSITGSTFSGTMSAEGFANSNINNAGVNAQYSGGFFGPEAEEVTGTMSMGTTGADGTSAVGMFSATK